MGVDARLTLPPQVRLKDAAEVLGILVGCKATWHVDKEYRFEACRVEGLEILAWDSPGLVECAKIQIDKAPLFGDRRLWVMYHFEFGLESNGFFGHHGMIERSYAEWIAVFKRMADFFGGMVDYQDCDSEDNDYVVLPPLASSPGDGEAWTRYERAKFNLTPVTKDEVEACRQFAAYQDR